MIRFTDLSVLWPEVVRFRERVVSRYRPLGAPDCVVIFPCSKRKPYSVSKSHRLFAKVLASARRRANIEEVTITSPLGAVPRALETVPPARSYDIAVTGIWSEEELDVVSQSLSSLLRKYPNADVVAHVTGPYLEACRRSEETLGSSFRYTGADRPASKEGLKMLSEALEKIVGTPTPSDSLGPARQVLSYQYGPEIAESMTLPPAGMEAYGTLERIVSGGMPVARRNPSSGLFTPEVGGARILADANAYCVDVDFKPKAKIVYCPGVISADAAIRPDDEVVVRWKGEPVAQGRSFLSGREMESSDRGRAVALREIFV